MKKNTRSLTRGAVIAAAYVVITLLQNLIFPNSASMAIQCRVAEALCVLALFSPSAIPGLAMGCLLFNLLSAATLPLDWFIGTAATLLATMGMYYFRKLRIGQFPLVSLLMPALANGLLVGFELTVYIQGSTFWFNALCVAAGELIVMLTLGTILYFALRPLQSRLFDNPKA